MVNIGQQVTFGCLKQRTYIVEHVVDRLVDIDAVRGAQDVEHIKGAAFWGGAGGGKVQFGRGRGETGANRAVGAAFAGQSEFDGELVEAGKPGVVFGACLFAKFADGL